MDLHQDQIPARQLSLTGLHRAGARAGKKKSGNIVLNRCTLVYSLNTRQPFTPFSEFTKDFHCSSSIIAYQQLCNSMINHCPEGYKTTHVLLFMSCLLLHSEVIWRQVQTKRAAKTNCWCCTTAPCLKLTTICIKIVMSK